MAKERKKAGQDPEQFENPQKRRAQREQIRVFFDVPPNEWKDHLAYLGGALIRVKTSQNLRVPPGILPERWENAPRGGRGGILPGVTLAVEGEMRVNEDNVLHISATPQNGFNDRHFAVGRVDESTKRLIDALGDIPMGCVLRTDEYGKVFLHPEVLVAASAKDIKILPVDAYLGVKGIITEVKRNERGQKLFTIEEQSLVGERGNIIFTGSLPVDYRYRDTEGNVQPYRDTARIGDPVGMVTIVQGRLLENRTLALPQDRLAVLLDKTADVQSPVVQDEFQLFVRYLTAAIKQVTEPRTGRVKPLKDLYKETRQRAAKLRADEQMTREQAFILPLYFNHKRYDKAELPIFLQGADRREFIRYIDERYGNGAYLEGMNKAEALDFLTGIVSGDNPGRLDMDTQGPPIKAIASELKPHLELTEYVGFLQAAFEGRTEAYTMFPKNAEPVVALGDLAQELATCDDPHAVRILLEMLKFSLEKGESLEEGERNELHNKAFKSLFVQTVNSLAFLVDENHNPQNKKALIGKQEPLRDLYENMPASQVNVVGAQIEYLLQVAENTKE